MDNQIQAVVEAFKTLYGERAFLQESSTDELIRLLLEGDRKKRMIAACEAGLAPLRTVIDDVETFANSHGMVVDGQITDKWKQDVGRLIGAIVYTEGYVSEREESLRIIPKYFHNASTFHKQI